ncbi:MAG TPA: SDR family oxidoreductase [Polyangiales bacterium]|nr:SDR family oxidoreductase [Polyangiales bacterium]
MTDQTSQPADRGVALITGANTGIGLVTARELARRGHHVFIACRSPARAENALRELRAQVPDGRYELLALDLGDFDSVRSCVRQFEQRGLPLSLLINNAGVAGARGLTKSGFELGFGINHMGHFLLTQLLLPRLREGTPARIVTVASKAHYAADGIDFEAVRRKTKTITGYREYTVSKLANVLFNRELARRLDGTGIHSYALHPGVVATEIWREIPWPFRSFMTRNMLTPEQGAATTLYCALSEQAGRESGLYYDDCKPKQPGAAAANDQLASELWSRSEAWVNAG